MHYAVELYFDSQLERAVAAVRSILAQAGLPTPERYGPEARPHVSLTGYDGQPDEAALVAALKEFAARQAHLELSFQAVGLFPTAEGVLFLAPTVTAELLAVHRAFHLHMGSFATHNNPYYVPGRWVPHCTVAEGLSRDQLAQAVRLCIDDSRLPLTGSVRTVGLIRIESAGPRVRRRAEFAWGEELR